MSKANDNNGNDSSSLWRQQLSSLDAQRKSLEAEAEAIGSELTAEQPNGAPPMGIDTPLVDREGYPRGDIDVYRARELRGRLAVIKTDHKALMKQIETALMVRNNANADRDAAEQKARAAPKPKPKYDAATGKWVVMNWDGTVAGIEGGDKRSFHALNETVDDKDDGSSASNTAAAAASLQQQQQALSRLYINDDDGDNNNNNNNNNNSTDTAPSVPFALIKSVAAESPADTAGIEEGDLVLRFGSIDHTNHRDLQAIGALVPMAAGANDTIPVVVQRKDDGPTRQLSLRPRPWAGRGLLGCHVVPYSE